MKNPKPITLTLSDQQIVLGARALAQAMFDMAIRGGQIVEPMSAITGSIVDLRKGEHCVGVSIHDNKPVWLVLLPGELEAGTWQEAQEWAKKQDGELPTRIDQLVLFKNLKSEFKEACYWSGEQRADGSAHAWGQGFDNGYQYGWHEGFKFRARAVRRVPI